VIVALAPPEVPETAVEAVLDAVAEVGVPNIDAGTVAPFGGGAFVGPVAGVPPPKSTVKPSTKPVLEVHVPATSPELLTLLTRVLVAPG
jgi:hypothetical protein